MNRPLATPGMCPYYDPRSKCCYLTERLQSGSQRDSKCMTRDIWTSCGNYEAKRSGRNYSSK